MAHVSLYRKYRPHAFSELVGQDHVTTTLARAVDTQSWHHAYLFTGPRGTGKTSSARLLAMGLNASTGPTSNPDPNDPIVAAIREGNCPDVIEIDAASNSGVDDVRELRDKINYLPTQGRLRIYIVDECHMLSNSAWNAFLKTIEEPPGHVVFIFATTEPHKVLATVLSRTQRFDFRRVSDQVLVDHCKNICAKEGITISDEALAVIVRAGDGSVRDTLSVLDQVIAFTGDVIDLDAVNRVLGVVPTALLDRLVVAIARQDVAEAFTIVGDAADQGIDLRQFALDAQDYLRELLVLRAAPQAGLIQGTQERLATLIQLANYTDTHRLLHAVEVLNDAQVRMRAGNTRLPLELALAKAVLFGEVSPNVPAYVAPAPQAPAPQVAKPSVAQSQPVQPQVAQPQPVQPQAVQPVEAQPIQAPGAQSQVVQPQAAQPESVDPQPEPTQAPVAQPHGTQPGQMGQSGPQGQPVEPDHPGQTGHHGQPSFHGQPGQPDEPGQYSQSGQYSQPGGPIPATEPVTAEAMEPDPYDSQAESLFGDADDLSPVASLTQNRTATQASAQRQDPMVVTPSPPNPFAQPSTPGDSELAANDAPMVAQVAGQTVPPMPAPSTPQAVDQGSPQPVMAQPTAQPSAQAQTAQPAGQLTVDQVQARWDQCVAAVGERSRLLWSYVSEGTPQEVRGSTLVIGFGERFFVDQVNEPDNKAVLSELFSSVLGSAVVVHGQDGPPQLVRARPEYEEPVYQPVIVEEVPQPQPAPEQPGDLEQIFNEAVANVANELGAKPVR